jgi:protein-S-isoprenylcysteine O-methyltransferase Ste14
MPPGLFVLAGAVLHAVFLLLPALVCGEIFHFLADPTVAIFLIMATLFYGADAVKDIRDAGPAQWHAAHATPSPEIAHRLALLTGLTLLTTFWVALAARRADPRHVAVWQQAVGAGAMLAGAVLRRLAVRRLGNFFVTANQVSAGQPLICDGIYRLLRHPSETGILAAALGAAILLGSREAAIISLAAILPLVVVRVRREDSVLQHAFGQAWDRYQSRTGGLLPKLFGPITESAGIL